MPHAEHAMEHPEHTIPPVAVSSSAHISDPMNVPQPESGEQLPWSDV